MKPQQVSFDLTMEDVDAFFRHVHYHRDPTRVGRRTARCMAAGLVVVALFIGVELRGENELADDFRWVAVVLLGGIGVLTWSATSRSQQAGYLQKNFEREGGLIRLGPTTVAIGPEGVTGTTPLGTQFVRWKAIRGVDSTPELVVLWMDNLLAIPVPVRAFPDRWAAEQFAQSARAYREREAPVQAEVA
jgi:hypothetical protein